MILPPIAMARRRNPHPPRRIATRWEWKPPNYLNLEGGGYVWRNSQDGKQSSYFNSFNGRTQTRGDDPVALLKETFFDGTFNTEALPRQVS